MILFARADNFYASCECLFRPDLARTPVVIVGEDGRVIAVNDAATAIGIHKGNRYADVAERAGQRDAAVFSPNCELYADMAARLITVCNRLCPDVEIHDAGECFLDYPDVKCPDFSGVAHHVRNTIIRETGLTVSIGIAPTRSLAKIAGSLAQRTGGIFTYVQANFAEVLSRVPVAELWGPGWAARSLVGRYATGTALELTEYPAGIPEKRRSCAAYAVAQELKGIPAKVIPGGTLNDLTESASFDDAPDSLERLDQALLPCVEAAVKRLGARHEKIRFLSLYLVATSKNGEGPRYCSQLTATLPYPTAFLPDILEQARALLGKIYRSGLSYRKMTVQLQKLEGEPSFPPEIVTAFLPRLGRFFRPALCPSRQVLDNSRRSADTVVSDKSVDHVPTCVSFSGFIQLARIAPPAAYLEKKWPTPARRLRSPAYTTEFADLPSVR